MTQLTEWLRLMLEEIARKHDDSGRVAAERALRAAEGTPAGQEHGRESTVDPAVVR
jgi:predicted Zn-dependent peptidase